MQAIQVPQPVTNNLDLGCRSWTEVLNSVIVEISWIWDKQFFFPVPLALDFEPLRARLCLTGLNFFRLFAFDF
jgi:hypothetical protein